VTVGVSMGAGVGVGAVVLCCSGARPFLAVRYKVKKRRPYVETTRLRRLSDFGK